MRYAREGVLCAIAGLGLAVMAGCHRNPPPVPLDQLNAEQARGREVFEAHCATCHYDRQEGSLHGPSLLSVFKRPYLPSGTPANDERVMETIQHGRNMMPPMGGSLDQQDLNDLLAYLHTL